jgi:hypothetical protein
MNWNRLLVPRPVAASWAAVAPATDARPASGDSVTQSRQAPSGFDWVVHLSYLASLAHVRQALRLGNWDRAEALLMRIGPVAGDDPAFCNLVGVIWEVKGNRRVARMFYGKAIRADSRYPAAQQNMRRIYELSIYGATQQPAALGDEPTC